MNCRHCANPLCDPDDVFIDLGHAPPSNAFRPTGADPADETWLPLKAYSCRNCRLVQISELQRADALFSADYVYFSSYSRSWLAHARDYVEHVVDRLSLGSRSKVMEVASNDGYLLQYLVQRGIPCIGIEPTDSTARVARERGVPTLGAFFGFEFAQRYAQEHGRVDLLLGNNVLAHVPDINDFVAGMHEALAPAGCITLEFPHLLRLVQQAQFDTVYHEHYSYLSLATVQRILAAQRLQVWDVQELPTHGGSLRVWAQHAGHGRAVQPAVAALLAREADAGIAHDAFYRGLQARAEGVRRELIDFLDGAQRDGRQVVGYGAAAKGNTLLNFAGVRADRLAYVVDASPHKQGLLLPGSHIPVVAEARLRETRPEYILLLPWNLREEISAQLAYTREWGAKLVTAVPTLRVD
jgi:SAM-dependent methyltransferase